MYQYIYCTLVDLESATWTNLGKYHIMIFVADLDVAHLEHFINKVQVLNIDLKYIQIQYIEDTISNICMYTRIYLYTLYTLLQMKPEAVDWGSVVLFFCLRFQNFIRR